MALASKAGFGSIGTDPTVVEGAVKLPDEGPEFPGLGSVGVVTGKVGVEGNSIVGGCIGGITGVFTGGITGVFTGGVTVGGLKTGPGSLGPGFPGPGFPGPGFSAEGPGGLPTGP